MCGIIRLVSYREGLGPDALDRARAATAAFLVQRCTRSSPRPKLPSPKAIPIAWRRCALMTFATDVVSITWRAAGDWVRELDDVLAHKASGNESCPI